VNRARCPDAIVRHTVGALIATGSLLAGCGTPHFASAPQPAVDLSGHWVLDPAASDDAAKMIAAITPPPRPRPPPEHDAAAPSATTSGSGRGGSGQGGQGGQGGHGGHSGGHGNGQSGGAIQTADLAPSWGRVSPRDFIAAFAMPPATLAIEQQPARVRIGASDARRREFQPGDDEPFSVTDRYGSRKVSAGWQNEEFVIHSADGSRLSVVEHLRRRADDHLETLVEFKAQGLKSISVHSVYRRATAAELEAPSEGPPAPAPH
jgi:hypothetical protein